MKPKSPDRERIDGGPAEADGKVPDILENVVGKTQTSSMLEMQTGLFNHGHTRAQKSGTTEPRSEDIRALEDHARAMARETYRDRYDPSKHAHDAMHNAEYKRTVAKRDEGEIAEQHAEANLRDAERDLAKAPKAGPKPAPKPGLITAFIVALALSIAPTLHDSVFHTIPDDLLAWFASLVSAGFVGAMLTLAILGGRRTKMTWIGVAAGVVLGLGLGVIRLSMAQGASEVLFALGLTIFEIAVVLLLEWMASGLRTAEAEWLPRHRAEAEAQAARDAAQVDLTRRQAHLKELNAVIAGTIAFVEDRHNRNIHIGELEAVAIKAVLDGHNAAITENIGRIRGVARRAK